MDAPTLKKKRVVFSDEDIVVLSEIVGRAKTKTGKTMLKLMESNSPKNSVVMGTWVHFFNTNSHVILQGETFRANHVKNKEGGKIFQVFNLFDMIVITGECYVLAICVRKPGPLKIKLSGTLFSDKNCHDDSFAQYIDQESESSKNCGNMGVIWTVYLCHFQKCMIHTYFALKNVQSKNVFF